MKRRDREDEGERNEKKNGKGVKCKKGKITGRGKERKGYRYNDRNWERKLKEEGKKESKLKVSTVDGMRKGDGKRKRNMYRYGTLANFLI